VSVLRAFGAVLWLCVACGGRDVGGAGQPGGIFALVYDERGEPAADFEVVTDPATQREVTDFHGSALLTNIPPGFYRVNAHIGSRVGSDAVAVQSGEIARVTLSIGKQVDVGTGGSSSVGQGGKSGSTGQGGRGGKGGTSGKGGASGGVISADYIDVATQVEAMVVDPKRPYLYAVDKVNNALLFVNLDTRQLEKSLFVGSSPVDLDIDEDKDELFIANFGSTQIAVVDLTTREIARQLFVDTSKGTWDGNPYRLAVTAANTLAFTSEDQWNNIKLVNATNGGSIDAQGSVYEPDLVASPDGTKLFVAESGSTGSALHRFDVTVDGLKEVDESGSASGYGARSVSISKDGVYLFYGKQKFLASNLKSVVGEFSEPVFATNTDGSIAIGKTNLLNGTNFSIIGPLVVSTNVMAISADDTAVYLYDANSSHIYIQPL
jgi:hypothetical protein